MQTSYAIAPAAAVAGLVADAALVNSLISKGAEVAIPFGVFVTQGTAASQAKLPTATGHVTGKGGLGFATADLSKEYNASGYAIDDAVPILRNGRVWVVCEEAMALGDSVFVRFAAGTGTQLGAVRNDADTATAVALQGAVVVTASSGAGICEIEFHVQTA